MKKLKAIILLLIANDYKLLYRKEYKKGRFTTKCIKSKHFTPKEFTDINTAITMRDTVEEAKEIINN